MRSLKVIVLVCAASVMAACSSSEGETGRHFGLYSVIDRGALKRAGLYNVFSTAVTMGTDKTIVDHIVSYQSGKDCSTVRSEQGRTYCREDENIPMPEMSCYRSIGDVTCYNTPDPARKTNDLIGTY